jgi:hypothetical protein
VAQRLTQAAAHIVVFYAAASACFGTNKLRLIPAELVEIVI